MTDPNGDLPPTTGRPRLYDEPMKGAKIMVPQEYDDMMIELGDGTRSKGGRMLIELFLELAPDDVDALENPREAYDALTDTEE